MIALLALLAQTALASPGLTHPEGTTAAVDVAEVVYDVKSDGRVHATFAMSYIGDAKSVGWLFPVVGRVQSVHNGNLQELVALRELSQPVLQRFEPSTGTEACGCAASQTDTGRDTGARAPLDGVQVVDSGHVGHHTYEIVTSNHAEKLANWIDSRGFVGFDTDDLQHYIDLGAQFVTVYFLPTEAETPEEGAALPPFRFVYEGELRYPALLARNQGNAEIATTLYVLGGGLAELQGGWSAAPVGTLQGTLDDDPHDLWYETRALAGADKNFVLTYGKGYDGRYLTRFDAVVPIDHHDADIVIDISSEPGIHETRIVLEEPASGGSAAILLLPLAGAALRRRRPRD